MVSTDAQVENGAERRERVAAHRRMAACRFATEEHEANAHALCRPPCAIVRPDEWLSNACELAVG